MKILFSNSPLNYSHGHVFCQPDWQTLILPTLAGIVGKKHQVRLVDNMRLLLRSNKILENIDDFKPDLAGFSVIAAVDVPGTLEIIREVRRKYPRMKIIAGAQAANHYHEKFLEAGVDVVVHQEGDITLPELLEVFERGETDYSSILGVSFLKDEKVVKTAQRPVLTNLDDVSFPDYDQMPVQKSKWFSGRLVGAIETARGCPFTCDFCAVTHFWGGGFRQKSNERVLEEMRILKSQGRTHIYIIDDSFGMHPEKHMELCESMIREKLDFKWYTQIRTDTVVKHQEMMALAARAGMYGGLIGFDTYEENTFSDVSKKGSIELNIEAYHVMKKLNIFVYGSHIYGLPSQKSPLDFYKTFRMGRKHSDAFGMPLFSPHPGTRVYDELVKEGKLNPKEGSDFSRLLVGNPKYQRKMTRWYYVYQLAHQFSPDEIVMALFHPDKVIRKFKFYNYVKCVRFVMYVLLRKLKLCNI